VLGLTDEAMVAKARDLVDGDIKGIMDHYYPAVPPHVGIKGIEDFRVCFLIILVPLINSYGFHSAKRHLCRSG
jgi:hypothetical protein